METLDLPWVEKYRPKTLSEVIGQKHIVDRLKAFVSRSDFPSMIFAGTAGVGKTTCAIAMANDLYGKDIGGAFKELNASVTPDTPILVRIDGKIERTTIGQVADVYFTGNAGKYAYPNGLEVLSLNRTTMKVGFSTVANISRHRASRIRKIKFEGGYVKTTPEHSIMTLGVDGRPRSVEAGLLGPGNLLISFKSVVDGSGSTDLDKREFTPNEFAAFKRGSKLVKFRNPKIRNVIKGLNADNDMAWFLGSYTAEGVAYLERGTSGITVLTYAYPKEHAFAERSAAVGHSLGFTAGLHTIVSGSSGKESGIQSTISSTQLANLLRANFYINNAASKTAGYKKVPGFVFDFPLEMRCEFLKGYAGDASGEWGDYLRYTSISQDLLVDVSWLARVSGLEATVFDKECRIIWGKPSSYYSNSEILAVEPFIRFLESVDTGFNWRYELRHSLYYKKSRRAGKQLIRSILEKLDCARLSNDGAETLRPLKMLAGSNISSPSITSIEDLDYDGYVYDFSVPGDEVFWGGTTPVLLHNSDARGIDVIRGEVKEFAKTLSIAKVPTKIIFLDEADSLTSDAQHALRRTMEKFARETRFILSANYASKLIEPIQSRCVVFRFKPLTEENMREYIGRIVKGEDLEVDDKAADALIYVGEGDLRKLTNMLQSAAMQSTKITESRIYDIAARTRPKEIASMIRYAISGDFDHARDELYNLLLKHGFGADDIITQCYREVPGMNLDEHAKLSIMAELGEYDFRISEGANERIQLEAMLAKFALIGRSAPHSSSITSGPA